ncbi:hypothetical protein HK096_004435, partial [Nowakowskiella sp. JEL0078]
MAYTGKTPTAPLPITRQVSDNAATPVRLFSRLHRESTSSSLSSLVSSIGSLTLRRSTLHPSLPPAKPSLLLLPPELLAGIFAYVASPSLFARVCKTFRAVSRQTHARCDYFIKRYGLSLCLVKIYIHHSQFLSPESVQIFLKKGAGLPRFFVQLVSNPQNTSATGDLLPYFVEEGYRLYGESLSLELSDIDDFEKLTNDMTENIDQIRKLITKFNF